MCSIGYGNFAKYYVVLVYMSHSGRGRVNGGCEMCTVSIHGWELRERERERAEQAESIYSHSKIRSSAKAEQSEDGARAGLATRHRVSIQYTGQTRAKQNGNIKRAKSASFWHRPTDWLWARLRSLKQSCAYLHRPLALAPLRPNLSARASEAPVGDIHPRLATPSRGSRSWAVHGSSSEGDVRESANQLMLFAGNRGARMGPFFSSLFFGGGRGGRLCS